MKHPAAEAFEFLLKNAAKNGDPHVQNEAGRHMAALNAEFSKFEQLEVTGAEEEVKVLDEANAKYLAALKATSEAEAAAETEAKAMSEAKKTVENPEATK